MECLRFNNLTQNQIEMPQQRWTRLCHFRRIIDHVSFLQLQCHHHPHAILQRSQTKLGLEAAYFGPARDCVALPRGPYHIWLGAPKH